MNLAGLEAMTPADRAVALMRLAGECADRHAEPGAKYPHPDCDYCAVLVESYATNPGATPAHTRG